MMEYLFATVFVALALIAAVESLRRALAEYHKTISFFLGLPVP